MSLESFSTRHIGPREGDIKSMLKTVGAKSIEELIAQTVPSAIRFQEELDVPEGISEFEYLNELKALAGKNRVFKSYIGLGYYGTVTPPPILRNILENPGWYTAYTPYQAEISQGRLEALLNFQTMVLDLTGMELANASLLDEATAAAEAMTMLSNLRKSKDIKAGKNRFFVADHCFPQTIELLKTRATPLGIELDFGDIARAELTDQHFGLIFQYTDTNGAVNLPETTLKKAQELGVKIAVGTDLLSLCLLKAPGTWGADVVFGNSQRFGVPMGYGGPHAAYFATREEFKRQIPGRIIGVSEDTEGRVGLRMALQTREQHIKRDKATSNICTAQALLAVMASMYAVYHGPNGLRKIAGNTHRKALALAGALAQYGFKNTNHIFFDTLALSIVDEDIINKEIFVQKIKGAALAAEINLRYSKDQIFIALDESTRLEDLNEIIAVFAQTTGKDPIELIREEVFEREVETGIDKFLREVDFLKHPVFNKYHSETELMRYMKRLENKDISLVHSMIPLGSCTMKLNAASELIPITWPEWANLHPFVPIDQANGYQEMIMDLNKSLCTITGFSGMSFQPNSGAQGEYAGLMVIRAYHHSRGDFQRTIALIPNSAHGTNPASAVMAGMKVVVVKCDEQGNIDVADLKAKAEEHKNELSCLMVTYPSTHGVYEASIKEITSIIHENGGQVYMDGANMNAQVGLTSPGSIGADVCHLNLHKTFAIPHGGGGPGMGPIGVAKHLTPFLPSHPVIPTGGEQPISAISSAPWGSALILLISYGYIRMLGKEGLRKSTEIAILNANYIKAKLETKYGILYTGENNRVAHEMILDCRPFKASAGVEVADIAKRLIDYGYHAPTVSFPVAGTFMIEPTESESKEELDRFCEAMLTIREEIEEIACGKYPHDNNVIINAPHTAERVLDNNWDSPYDREKAVYPMHSLRSNKYWPPVSRIDNAKGDRNLICSCPSIEEYADSMS